MGDLAETIALLVRQEIHSTPPSLSECINEIINLKSKDEKEKKVTYLKCWKSFNDYEKFVFNKILTGFVLV